MPKRATTPDLLEQRLKALKKPQVEEVAGIARQWLAQERTALKERFLRDGHAARLLAGYTRSLDMLLKALYALYGDSKARIALVATGGYGRREMFPYSDLDIVLLFEGAQSQQAEALTQALLYVLWDAGLKVGHSHRSIEEALELAQADITIRTSLLDARLVAGSRSVFTAFQKGFAELAGREQVGAFIEAKLAERDARHQRFGDSRYMLEPNVKEGKGALRDLHTLWWMARYSYPIHELADLVETGHLTPEEYATFARARDFLWRVRGHLHFIAGRPEDRLTFDRQLPLAEAMGYTHAEPTHAISRFMRRYFAAVRLVGEFTRIFCALLEEEKKRSPRRILGWFWYAPWMFGPFHLEGERLQVRSEHHFTQNPSAMIEIFRVAQTGQLDIHPKALQLIGRSLHLIDDAFRRDMRANGYFLDILLAESGVETTLRRMSEAGVLGRFIPDFGRVIGQTQFNRYHVYTVDEHTLVALGILGALERGELREEAPLVTSVFQRIHLRRALYLALFCHDIGKGRPSDHSEVGERIARRLAERFGFSREEQETAAWLVRQHLLLSQTAFKRDLDDPKAVQDFIAEVRSPERLKLLLCLTVADIRAVGPGTWNEWKAAQLRDLYFRAEQAMGAGTVIVRLGQYRFRDELAALLPGWQAADIDAYIEAGGPAFISELPVERHAALAQLTGPEKPSEGEVRLAAWHDEKLRLSDIALCAQDRPRLFSQLAGALSLAGANIISARVFTLKNGLALDMFQVQDAAGDPFNRPERIERLQQFLQEALQGKLDPIEKLKSRKRAGFTISTVQAQVLIDNDASNIYSVIELSAPDYPGLLSRVTRAMAGLGLSIATAHISTYGTEAVDVFYVKDAFGLKITHDARLKQVRERLLATVTGINE